MVKDNKIQGVVKEKKLTVKIDISSYILLYIVVV